VPELFAVERRVAYQHRPDEDHQLGFHHGVVAELERFPDAWDIAKPRDLIGVALSSVIRPRMAVCPLTSCSTDSIS
jgi:hypothetical protein